MQLSCLKAKPPQIVWTPSATTGLAAAVGSYVGTPFYCEPLVAYTTSIFVAVAGLTLTKKRVSSMCIPLAVFLLFLGRSSADANSRFPPWTLLLDGEVVRLRCEITSSPRIMSRTRGEMVQFDHRGPVTRFYALVSPTKNKKQQLASTRISVRVNGKCDLHKGEVVDCVGWFRNSAHGDTTQHALYVSAPEAIQKNRPAEVGPIERFQQRVRQSVLFEIRDKHHALANALLFGVRGKGWNEISTLFRISGMSHILAISGLHVGIIVLLALRVARVVRITRIATTLFVLVVVIGVLAIIEARSPAIRAAIMLSTALTLQAGGLRCNPTGLLGTSALVLLFLYPRDAGTVGFQLSFVVVTALCVLLPRIKWRLMGPTNVFWSPGRYAWNWIASLWVTGLCAWAVASPITAHTFGTFSPSGLITNVPAIGLLMISIVAGVSRLCVGWLSAATDLYARELLTWALSSFLFMAQTASEFPLAHVQGISLTWGWSATMLSWVTWWSVAIRNRWRIWAVLPVILFGIYSNEHSPPGAVVITTIHVGHGTCHIVQHGKYTMMVDCGSKSNLDVGTNTILPMARSLGVTAIDTLVITHSDLDHIVGIVDVLNSLAVSRIIIAKQAIQHQTESLKLVLDTARTMGVNVVDGAAGWNELSGDLSISIVSPRRNERFRSSNAASIVLMLHAHGKSALFTGDIDEQKIIEVGGSLVEQVDLVELPHHGQWSHESQQWINTLRPRAIIQSTSQSRHTADTWTIPHNTSRFVTAVDGTLTTTIFPSGTMVITGSKHPVSMPPCYISN
jgi:ComEC/Rec2-related protein